MHRDYEKQLRNYHQAKWNEELIFDLSVPGERGVLVTPADASVIQEVGSGLDTIPASLKRKKVPNLPEVKSGSSESAFHEVVPGNPECRYDPGFRGNMHHEVLPEGQEHASQKTQFMRSILSSQMRQNRVCWRFTMRQSKCWKRTRHGCIQPSNQVVSDGSTSSRLRHPSIS